MFAKRKQSNWATGGLVIAALVVVNGIGFLAYRSVTAGRIVKADTTQPSAATTLAAPAGPPLAPPSPGPASPTADTAHGSASSDAAAAPQPVDPSTEQASAGAVAPVDNPDDASAKPGNGRNAAPPRHRQQVPRVPKAATNAKGQAPPKKAGSNDDDGFILEQNPYTHNH